MQATIVKYRVKSDRVDENIEFVRAVFASLSQSAPDGVHYATFQGEDGVSFTHVAVFDSDQARGALGATEAFQAFTAHIADRCDVPPAQSPQTVVGSFKAFS